MYEVVGDRDIARTDFLHLVSREVVAPDGTVFHRQVVKHTGAVCVVPVVEADVLMIRQYRAAVGKEMLELPAGKRDRPDENLEALAIRECEEEIGFRPGRLELLSTFYTAPGFSDELMYLYLADQLSASTPSPDGIEEQHAEIVRMPLRDAVEMARTGRIVDAKTIVGLLLAAGR